MDNETVEVTERVHSHPVARSFRTWLGVVSAIIVLGIVGYAAYLVRAYVPLIGYIWLGAIALIPVFVVMFTLVYLLRLIFSPTITEIGPNGNIITRLWHIRTVRPLPLDAVSEPGHREVKPKVDIPTLSDLLQHRILDGTELLLGYHADGSSRWGSWNDIRTFAIAGKSRSGKTVTTLFLILQALLSGAIVWVCDPHYTKKTGLATLLRPLEQFPSLIRIAGTDEDMMSLVYDYREEMEKRRLGESAEQLRPRLLVIDEWTRLMIHLDKSDKETLSRLVIDCAEQYAGYNGFAMVAGHEWTARESGGSNLRRGLHAVFVHRLDEDYAKFLLLGGRGKKAARQAPNLHTGHCFFQDSEGQLDELIIPYGNKEDVTAFCALLPDIGLDFPLLLPEPVQAEKHTGEIDIQGDMPVWEQKAERPYSAMPFLPLLETSRETSANGNGPVSYPGNGPDTRPDIVAAPVSSYQKQEEITSEAEKDAASVTLEPWKREIIQRAVKMNMPFREIAALVGMSGGSYKRFQTACKEELGIDTSKSA